MTQTFETFYSNRPFFTQIFNKIGQNEASFTKFTQKLKQNQTIIAEPFEAVINLFANLFSNIVDFTPLAAYIPATQLVRVLNDIFSDQPDHTDAIANMALGRQQAIAHFRDDLGQPF